MKLSRRNLIKSTAAATVVAAASAKAGSAAAPALFVYDSRSAESRALAKRHLCPSIDVAKEDANFWSSLRTLSPSGPVIGLTSWSDLVMVRGFLEEKGLRLKSEKPRGALFHWSMR